MNERTQRVHTHTVRAAGGTLPASKAVKRRAPVWQSTPPSRTSTTSAERSRRSDGSLPQGMSTQPPLPRAAPWRTDRTTATAAGACVPTTSNGTGGAVGCVQACCPQRAHRLVRSAGPWPVAPSAPPRAQQCARYGRRRRRGGPKTVRPTLRIPIQPGAELSPRLSGRGLPRSGSTVRHRPRPPPTPWLPCRRWLPRPKPPVARPLRHIASVLGPPAAVLTPPPPRQPNRRRLVSNACREPVCT